MSAPDPQIVGYAVTVEVIVPLQIAQRSADRLDATWHLESWSPAAAASVAVEDALKAAGLRHQVHLGTRGVTAGEPGAAG
jgi:hypothetical protein